MKRWSWFILANAAIVLSLSLISGGALLAFSPFFLMVGCLFPFVSLLFSKQRAILAHGIQLIHNGNFPSPEAKSLYEMVESFSRKAGLKVTPEVGVYESGEMNAFATGASKASSLVAFSTGLLSQMDEEAIAAVAAHEIAHIANGDMVTMALVQSVVNIIVYLLSLPLSLLKWFVGTFNDSGSVLIEWGIAVFKFLVTLLLLFLGSLVVKAFSRKREFEAYKLAARLLAKNAMIHALESLRHDHPVVLREQKSYAAFKINSSRRWLDILSTHPSLERRIQALQSLQLD